MSSLHISLFGKMHIEAGGVLLTGGLDARKVQELLGYLLLNRERPHTREALADVLWGDSSGEQARKYLRQALWQLQASLKSIESLQSSIVISTDAEWVGISPGADVWTDVGQLEDAFRPVQGKPGHELSDDVARRMADAVELYSGGLLEGWYQEWCVFERERLENIYLAILNKLMSFHEARGSHEIGIIYGHRILKMDRAHERTHWAMMRLYYLAGDRTSALRQYARCVTALNEELGVSPAKMTQALCEQIRSDTVPVEFASAQPYQVAAIEAEPADSANDYVYRLQSLLNEFRYEVRRYMSVSGTMSGD